MLTYPREGPETIGVITMNARTIVTSLALSLSLVAIAPRTAHPQASATVSCRVLENGAPASGTMVIRSGQQQVATGACGAPVSVRAGAYEVVIRLDGALDRPEQIKNVTVGAAGTSTVSADFPTAILEVRITSGGQRAAGMATLTRAGQQIGTLGSGVAGHLSAGTYDIVARYRTQERRFDAITLAPGQRRALSAAF